MNMSSKARTVLFQLLTLTLLSVSSAASSPADLLKLVDRGGYMIQGAGDELQLNARKLYIPASTLKILTSLFALESLGHDFRFETHFFLDAGNNLYIKGYGDPFLTSEAVLQISRELFSRGIVRLNSLFLDDSSFMLDRQVADPPSSNPYDAPNGALAVNFNALPIRIAEDGSISSGEPQTPPLEMIQLAGRGYPPGSYRLNVNATPGQRQLTAPLHYTGELFLSLFEQVGITVEKGFTSRNVPSGLHPVYIHYGTHSLEEIVRACLKYSNNFIANQLFLAVGTKYFGLPATWEKSRQAMEVFSRTILDPRQHPMQVVEGSGLSRGNRISAATLIQILSNFEPYSHLLPIEHNILLKTGTMENVFCYAGYVRDKNGLVPLAILLNQKRNTRDDLVKLLLRFWQEHAQFK